MTTQRLLKSVSLAMLLFALGAPVTRAALIYTYDFPNDPGSGLAADQTTPQPSGATMSDFTRTNVTVSGGAGIYNSINWSTAAALDPTVYEGFSIVADANFVLNLSSLSFDAKNNASGPANMEVALFLNGSLTPYATFDFSPTSTSTTYTFNFTPLTTADNVTSATFNFYGWNAATTAGKANLDNVSLFGAIASVPEASVFWPIVPLLLCVLLERRRRRPVSRTIPRG